MFRNEYNQRLTKALFLEESYSDPSRALYTLKDEDYTYNGKKYSSLYKLYMEMGDISEYYFAKAYTDGPEHWDMLCSCKWFQPYVTSWRKELIQKLKADALEKVISVAKDPNHKSSYEANKYILAEGWVKKTSGKVRGRPTKEEISRELAKDVAEEKALLDDLKRLQANQKGVQYLAN